MLTNDWNKSTRSGAAGHCVEVRKDGEAIQMRDSKDKGAGPVLSFTTDEWNAFVGGAQDGEFDL